MKVGGLDAYRWVAQPRDERDRRVDIRFQKVVDQPRDALLSDAFARPLSAGRVIARIRQVTLDRVLDSDSETTIIRPAAPRFQGVNDRVIRERLHANFLPNRAGAPRMRRRRYRVGDGVAPVALSHHRTCGSAYGGSLNNLEALPGIQQRNQS